MNEHVEADVDVNRDLDGRRFRIALLIPSTGLIDGELCDIAEERGAEALIFRVVPGAVADPRDVSAVASMVLEMGHPEQLSAVAARTVDVAPDVVAWACTSGSFLGAADASAEQVAAMTASAGGIPATTTSLAMLHALRRRSAARVSVVTPYHPEIGGRFARYLRAHGIDVAGEAHAGCGSDAEVGRLAFDDLAPLADDARGERVDALAIPCTGLRRRDLAERLGERMGCPVILANIATVDCAVELASERLAPGRAAPSAVPAG